MRWSAIRVSRMDRPALRSPLGPLGPAPAASNSAHHGVLRRQLGWAQLILFNVSAENYISWRPSGSAENLARFADHGSPAARDQGSHPLGPQALRAVKRYSDSRGWTRTSSSSLGAASTTRTQLRSAMLPARALQRALSSACARRAWSEAPGSTRGSPRRTRFNQVLAHSALKLPTQVRRTVTCTATSSDQIETRSSRFSGAPDDRLSARPARPSQRRVPRHQCPPGVTGQPGEARQQASLGRHTHILRVLSAS